MRPFRAVPWVCALLLLAANAGSAHSAWCNVFQLCCDSYGGQPAVSYYPAVSFYEPAPCVPQPVCAPQPVCGPQMVQRCYYQPVTSYESRSYYEPVTSYRTSYYYEPVTSYRYSSYYDACTGTCQQVACPETSYRVREQVSPVQSWVQRCTQVPVTTYRQSCYWEPAAGAAPYGGAPGVARAGDDRVPAAPPAVREHSSSERPSYYPPSGSGADVAAPATLGGNSSRQVPRRSPTIDRLVPVPAAPPQPKIQLERVVAAPVRPGLLQGRIVHNNDAPQAGAQLVFVNVNRQGSQQNVTADRTGRFRATLASGSWWIYVGDGVGKPVYHSRLEVRGEENRQVTLVAR